MSKLAKGVIDLSVAIDMLPYFDIIKPEFLYNLSDVTFSKVTLADTRLNDRITKSLQKFYFWQIMCQVVFDYNDNFIYFDIVDDNTLSLVIGYKDEPILKMFTDKKSEEIFEMQLLRFKEYLAEMAMTLGKDGANITNQKIREKQFDASKDHNIDKTISDNVKVHKHMSKNTTEYSTNDHRLGETIHHSIFKENKSTNELPHEHIEQTHVQRVPTNQLPKNFATDLAYEHYKKQELPLKSSTKQYDDGHKMWHKLVDKALDDKQHVYHWDGNKLHKTTQDNKKEHLANSYGGNPDNEDDPVNKKFENRHMIISKHELKN